MKLRDRSIDFSTTLPTTPLTGVAMAMAAVFTASIMSGAQAGSIDLFNEAVDGELSDDNLAPTPLVFQLGSNRVSGATVPSNNQGEPDRDFFTFTIPQGWSLTQVVLASYTNEDDLAFLAIGGETSFSNTIGSDILGAALIGDGLGISVGDDVLDDLATGQVAGDGFTTPLGPGDYSIWYQETAGNTTYTLDFQVVPEPTGAGLLLMAGTALIARRRR